MTQLADQFGPGDVVGRLTVLEVRRRTGGASIVARCSCGNRVTKRAAELRRANRNGYESACIACRYKVLSKKNATHGATRTPEHVVWVGMRGRCSNPNAKEFPRYGGRGIYVDDRWSNFASFLADMGPRPSPEHTIDRIDNDGPYSPENCRWATRKEQAINRRSTVRVDGGCLKDAAAKAGLPYMTVWLRVQRYGWSVERALSAPHRGYGPGMTRADFRRRQEAVSP